MPSLGVRSPWQVYCLFAQKLFIKQRSEINKYVQFELVCLYCLWFDRIHSIRFWVFLSNNSKNVQNDLWLFQLFLAFFNSLYQELSGYVSQMSLVLHIYPQEVQEHRLFCSFSWKIRFLLLVHVGKRVKNCTGAHMCTQIQLVMNNLSPTNLPIIKNQVQLGAFKV